MTSLLQLRDYSFLSQAAYRDLSKLRANAAAGDLQNALKDPNEDLLGAQNVFSETQAGFLTGSITVADLTDGYSFINYHGNADYNDLSGFSASVFKSNKDSSYTIAVRGTEPTLLNGQAITDLLIADGLGVALTGMAREQIVNAYRYYKQLTAVPGQAVVYTTQEKLQLAGLYAGAYSPLTTSAAYAAISTMVLGDVGLGSGTSPLIPAGATVNFTGHSLGGHVATVLAQLIAKNSPGTVGDVVTYNAPGTGGIAAEILSWCGINGADITISSKITNVIGEGGMNVTAGLGFTAGTRQNVFIEGEGAVSIANHSVVKLSDSLALYDTFSTLSPALQLGAITDIIKASSTANATSLEAALDALRTLLIDGDIAKNTSKQTPTDNRDKFYENLYALQKHSNYTTLSGSAGLTPLAGQGGSTLASQGKTDFGRFLALDYLLPFALDGASSVLIPTHQTRYDAWQADQSLAPDEKTSGAANYSDRWYAERARMLDYWLDNTRSDGQRKVDRSLSANRYYEDKAKGISFIVDRTSNTSPSNTVKPMIIFGSDDSDPAIAGQDDHDVLFGGGGDDTVEGAGGNDYLEGNAGVDTLKGGDDNDTLLGGAGNDQLTGGKDNDTLKGGDGNDTYLFANGDGWDWVEDSDGEGQIKYNDEVLTGGQKVADNIWQFKDANGQAKYTFSLYDGAAYGQSGQILAIQGPEGGMYVKNWQAGQLGIQLDDAPMPPPPSSQIMGTDEHDNGLLRGVADNSPLLASAPDQEVHGLGGADVLWLRYDKDVGYGGTGNDILMDSFGNQELRGEQGNDLLIATSGQDKLYGGSGDDALQGGEGSDTLDGGDGMDLIDGGIGADVINGGDGDDFILGGGNVVPVVVDSPDPYVEGLYDFDAFADGRGHFSTYYDASGNRWVPALEGVFPTVQPDWGYWPLGRVRRPTGYLTVAEDGADFIDAGPGKDWVYAGYGNDQVKGGAGEDWLRGNRGDDSLFGEADDDRIFGDGSRSDYTQVEAPGTELVWDHVSPEFHGNDYLDGGAGADYLQGDGGNDELRGGAGDDSLDGDARQDRFDPSYHGVDLLYGGAGNDILRGSGKGDRLFGGDDADELYGDALSLDGQYHGNDSLEGENGSDSLFGQGGDDILVGGDGDDHLEGDYDPVELDGLFHGNDFLDGGAGIDVLIGLGGNDVLFGGDGDDALAGDQADNAQLDAQYQGADYLDGGAGNDYLTGHGGNDTLVGGAGDDTLHGDEGNDTLIGGTGIDRLEGGSGNDRYELSGGDAQVGADGVVDSGGDDTLALAGSIVDLWKADGGLLAIQFGSTDVVVVDNEGVDIEHYEIGGETLSYAQLIGRYSADAISGVDQEGQSHATGGYGADTLTALDGNTNFSGGMGDDSLAGAGGGNTYHYSDGDGNDVITDTSHANGASTANGLVFGSGITTNDVDLYRNGTSLFARLTTGEQITVTSQFASTSAIDTIQFADGTIWDTAAMASRTTLELTAGADSYTGTAADDRVSGLGGNDTLNGGAGNDTLSGGAGNDTLSGGLGADTYLFNIGDGIDQVNENGDVTSIDVLRFGAGVAASNVRVVTNPGGNMTFYVGSESIAFRYAMSVGSETIKGIERVEFADGSAWDYAEILRRSAEESATTGNDTIYGFDGNETMHGLAGNDKLYGRGGDDQLYGEDGTDTLDGGDGNDTLDGGSGNDTLAGGAGSDVYLFARGGGIDTINNNDTSTNKIDAVQFAADIAPTDVKVSSSGDYLVLTLAGTTDQLMVPGYFINEGASSYKIEEIRFADGTVWNVDTVKALAIAGTPGSDTLYAYATDDTLDGLAGSDYLYGRAGNDTLRGGADNDYLYGEAGDDVLDGGLGNDQLYGASGSDTFLFGRASGSDTIACDDTSTTTVDAVILDADVTPAGVQVGHVGNDLTLTLGSGNALTLAGYFANNGSAAVDEIRFADGTIWRHDQLRASFLTGGSGPDTLSGFDSDDVMTGGDGNDSLYGGAGNDVIDGVLGNDALYGEAGNDLLNGGVGNDTMDGGAGDDVYRFGRGDGQDTITEHWTVSAMDTLELGAGIVPADVGLYRNGNDLMVVLDNSPTQIKVKDFYLGTSYQIERIRFADATEWDAAAIAARTASGAANAMTGTAGNDTFVVDNTGDTITEGANQGIDAVQSSVTWTLGANIENLTLTGVVNIDGTGNTLDNVIVGNSGNNALKGGGGTDTLRGGAGDDTYDNQQGVNTVVELAGEGVDNVKINSSYVLPDNVENVAIGGFWNSTYKFYLTGNSQDNVMQSRVGDVIDGGAGADTMIFSTGLGSAGTYFPAYEIAGSTAYVDNAGDIVVGADANARIISSIDYVLGDGVGRLELAADSGAVLGTGNALNNLIKGNEQDNTLAGLGGNDTFYGGIGSDTLVGGAGDDSYYLDSGRYYNGEPYVNPYLYQVLQPDDAIVEQAGEGADTVYSIYDYVLGDNLENLVLQSFSGNTGSQIGTFYAMSATGNSLDNLLVGNAGANVLNGAAGADRMKGMSGDDIYHVDEAADLVVELAGEGTDTVYSQVSFALGANVENLTLVGSAPDVATGNALNNTLDGSQSDGANQLIGGLGDDTYILGVGDTAVEFAGEGNDTVVTSASYALVGSQIENISLSGTANIDATGNELDNVLEGNSGNNRLDGGAGSDTYRFGRGGGQDTVADADGTAGNLDQIIFKAGVAVADIRLSRSGDNLVAAIFGTTDQITIEGQFGTSGGGIEEIRFEDAATVWTAADIARMVNNQAPVVASLIPNQSTGEGTNFSYTIPAATFSDPDVGDTLGYSATLADGSALPSWLTFNSTTRVFSGTPPMGSAGVASIRVIATDMGGLSVADTFDLTIAVQNLTLNGTSSANTLTGGGGNDTLNGLGGNDTLYGNAGNDTLDGGTGNDKMYGGLGDDTYVVNVSTDTIYENANEGIDTVKSSVTLTLGTNVENLTLTGTSAIKGTGNALNNVLTGNSAANTLTGGAGNDTIDGGAGSDTMVGGAGDDTYFVNVSTDKTTENANEGTDTVRSSVTLTLGNNVENLTLTGTSAINGTGNTLNNVLTGNTANNTLTGNAGNDTLDGGAGTDSLVGGTGNDTYILGRGYGADTVTENDSTAGNTDIASFLSGIATDQIWFRHVGTALEVSVIGTTDKLTINSWYSGSQYHVEQFKTADGKTLVDTKVETLVQAMAAFSPPAAGQTTLPPTYQDALGTTIAANWQ